MATLLLVLAMIGGGWWWTERHRAVWSKPVAKAARLAVNPSPAGLRPSTPDKSIAVLPFENLGADKENIYFADGVQDEILTNLAKVADLKVISRTSIRQYRDVSKRHLRDIGAQLGVAHVLEGSVQREGNKVRVNAQLIDARTDTHLWAEQYDRPLNDVFAIQSEIAETIAGQLKARLSPQEKIAIDTRPTSDLVAYDLYLRAKDLHADSTVAMVAAEKLPAAVRLLNEAVARDPNFLRAWCLLEVAHCLLYWQGHDHTPERLELAHAAMQHAFRLQPDAGETHLAWADYYYHGFRDYPRALAELNLARHTLPNNAQVYEYSAWIERRQGRWDESVRDAERSLELDPRNFFVLIQQSLTYQMLHRYDEMMRLYGRALAIVPDDPGTLMLRAKVALDEYADVRPAQETLARLLRENPANGSAVDDINAALCEHTVEATNRALAHLPPDGLAISGTFYPHAYFEAVVARCQGDARKARSAFAAARIEVEKTVTAQPTLAAAVCLLGVIDAGLGNKELAIAEGRRGGELLPISKDAVDGPDIAISLAMIYAWTGDSTAAIEQLETIRRTPSLLTYGYLKLNPAWDTLRANPRFEALVNLEAPRPK